MKYCRQNQSEELKSFEIFLGCVSLKRIPVITIFAVAFNFVSKEMSILEALSFIFTFGSLVDGVTKRTGCSSYISYLQMG